MKHYRILIIVLVVFFYQCKTTTNLGEEEVIKNQSNPMEIYLLIGQSNMAGRAAIELQDQDSINHVFLFTGNEKKPWEKAANPLNKYSTVRKKIAMQKLGPGYGFAKEMAKTNEGNKIGLVVNAKGGTSIEAWKPGDVLYNEALSQTKKALKHGVLKGVLWHQGEANASKYNEYMPKIIELITALRQDLELPDLPFVVGQLSSDKPKRNNFNKMILELPNHVKNASVVLTEKLSTIDSTHFDSASQRLLGKRYAKNMLKLITPY
ncbi:sialate O-acetylesterase [Flavivirga jejuensis]|uniref:Sialate O-acetylesterase n=1 Tax=Flavivirga jejuensis TaxID=870487 RepID=A0ABT8WML1_9FLAO|nr:sialate O-acetylesterase [Flavivirga jejuensis]MDO5974275.1 sialate O-acetylesterase [Flavivirga jejuensis]